MDMSRWLSEMGMEDSDLIDEYQMDTFCDLTAEQLAAAFGEDYQHSSSSDSSPLYSTFSPSPLELETCFCPSPLELEATQTCFEKPAKQLKTADSGSDGRISKNASVNQNYAPKAGSRKKRAISTSSKPESCTHDHIIAERKRREKLSQQFITLTTIVPGLKKMDKSSVLGDTIEYLKLLQERVQTLEAKQTTESAVFVKKFQILLEDDDTSSTDDNSSNSSSEPLPEIEARVSGKNVLIRIHCEKQRGVFGKALDAIEELNLTVVNSSITPFGSSTLDITVVAQMDEGYKLAVKDLLTKLRSTVCKFM